AEAFRAAPTDGQTPFVADAAPARPAELRPVRCRRRGSPEHRAAHGRQSDYRRAVHGFSFGLAAGSDFDATTWKGTGPPARSHTRSWKLHDWFQPVPPSFWHTLRRISFGPAR